MYVLSEVMRQIKHHGYESHVEEKFTKFSVEPRDARRNFDENWHIMDMLLEQILLRNRLLGFRTQEN